MTTVTNLTAATPGNGVAGPAQGAGSAIAGFEALLAAFFGEVTATAPTQGAPGPLTPAPAAPVLLNGDVVVTAEAPLVGDILAKADGETATGDQAPAAVDPTLLVDIAAIVAPQQPVPVAQAATTTTVAAPETTAPGAKTTPPVAVEAVAAPTIEATTPQAAEAVATEAVAAEAGAETVAPPQAPAHGRGKAKGAPAAPAAPVAHANAQARAEDKAAAPEIEAQPVDGELTPDTPAAKAAPPVGAEHAKAPVAQAKAAPAPAAAPAATVAVAPTADADPIELPAAVAAAVEAADTGAEPATPAAANPGQDVTAAVAGKVAAATPRPREAKEPAKAEGQPTKAGAKEDFLATAAAVRKSAPATAAKQADAASSRNEREVEAKPLEAAPKQVDDAPAHVHEERSTEVARGPNAAPHAQHAVRGSPETVANLAAQIIKKLNGKATRFDIELTPQGMGTVDVRVEIQNGRVTAAMMFDNPQSAAEMKARASELQRSLEQAGFDLSGGLSFEAKDGGEAGRGWRQAQDNNDGRGLRGQAFRNAFDTANEAADVAESGALRLRRGVNSGLDVRV